VILIAAAAAAWVAACGLPRRTTGFFLLLALVMFLPYFLLVPLLLRYGAGPASASLWERAFAGPWTVLLHGTAGMFIAAATVAALGLSELRSGLAALPLPRAAVVILLQIVHQTSTLLSETKRMVDAAAVRGASGGGRAVLRVLMSLPRVWLPRVLDRADRVAAAMELRDYTGAAPDIFGRAPFRAADVSAVFAGSAVLALAVFFRWGGIG
jgi:energy-coupling factor transporter transmembrane protein EcfT